MKVSKKNQFHIIFLFVTKKWEKIIQTQRKNEVSDNKQQVNDENPNSQRKDEPETYKA